MAKKKHIDTPYKAASARTSKSNKKNLAQNRDRHMRSAQNHTRASPLSSWFKAYAKEWTIVDGADMDSIVDHLVKAKHLSVGTEGQWTAVPRKRRDGTNENSHFAGMEKIWESVLNAAEEVKGGSSRVDAISQLCESSYPTNTQYALPGSAKKAPLRYNADAATAGDDADLGQQAVVFTADVAVTYEWKLEQNAEAIANNDAQTIGATGHIMFNDVTRAWHYSVTIEKASVRLWCHSRGHTGMSKRFDMHTAPRELIHFILFSTYSTKKQLGFDPRTTRVIDDKGQLQYRFTVRRIDSDDPDDQYLVWQTTRILDERSAGELYSRAMRVYAIKPVGEDGKVVQGARERVKRDFWVFAHTKQEKVIQQDILKKIAASLEPGEDLHDIEQHFMRFLTDEIVAEAPPPPADSERYWFADRRNPAGKQSSKARITNNSLRSEAGEGGPSGSEDEDEDEDEELELHGKVRIESIYDELCEDMYHVDDPAEYFYALSICVKILSYLRRAGYLHRDISPGNFLLYFLARQATAVSKRFVIKIADLEYAKEYLTVSRHDPITGTAQYMAVEVQSRSHLLVPLEQVLVPATDFFSYNPYHDLESVMWMALAFVMSRMSLTILREENWQDLADAVAGMASDAARVFVNNICGSSARNALVTESGPKVDLQENLESLYGEASPVTTLPNLLQDIWLAYSALQSKSAKHVTNNRYNLSCFDDRLYRKLRVGFETISNHFVESAEPLVLLSQIDRTTGNLIPDHGTLKKGGKAKVASQACTVSFATKRKADEPPATAQPSEAKLNTSTEKRRVAEALWRYWRDSDDRNKCSHC
uniref:Protein kinase domain-containing protein n=1 Tax=Schizophyllum commune (strain H4-8 / FGSC 9210) TaxID=578458 RepID=D8PKK7_SCHCM